MAESGDRLSAVPFPVVNGWPEQLDENLIRACEAGIVLGEFFLPGLLAVLRRQAQPALSIRIDEDPQPEEWKSVQPGGSESVSRVVMPPDRPVSVPTEALADDGALANWVGMTHGSWGRVLVWGADGDWWIVNDPDLEVSLVCGPPDWVESVSYEPTCEPFAWLPDPSAGDLVRAFYGL